MLALLTKKVANAAVLLKLLVEAGGSISAIKSPLVVQKKWRRRPACANPNNRTQDACATNAIAERLKKKSTIFKLLNPQMPNQKLK